MLRLELLNVKADLERELGRLVLHCTACGRTVHWVAVLACLLVTGRIESPRRMASRMFDYAISALRESPAMRRLAGILGVAVVSLLPGCAEDTNTRMPSEGAKTAAAGTQSLQPTDAPNDRTFAGARADAVPLIRKAMDELDEVQVPCRLPACSAFAGSPVDPNTATPGSNLKHVTEAMDLVQQACFIFDGVDDEIAGYLCSAADHLIGAMNSIGSTPRATGAAHELRIVADKIDAANELLRLPITT